MSLPSIDEIVSALNTTRAEFSRCFLKAQLQSGIILSECMGFDALTSNMADFQEAQKMGIGYAIKHGFIDKLVSIILMAGLENGELTNNVLKNEAASLHRVTDPASGLVEPYRFETGSRKARSTTGMVMVDNKAAGTGVLVGPHLLLTNWHLIAKMFRNIAEPGQPPLYLPSVDSHRLSVIFDNFIDQCSIGANAAHPCQVGVHSDWLVCFSPCHEDELSGRLPHPPDKLEAHADYAIIRLEKCIGNERGWVRLEQLTQFPLAGSKLVLFSHPEGYTLKMDYTKLLRYHLKDAKGHPLRLIHGANTFAGSSGAPAYNEKFTLIGIHQGGIYSDDPAEEPANRAVPVNLILKDIEDKMTQLPGPSPADSRIWRLNEQYDELVIGNDDWQERLWEASNSGEGEIITIRGADKSGRTFLTRMAQAILPDSANLKLIVHGEVISPLSVPELAGMFCRMIGAPPPACCSLSEHTGGVSAWLKSEVLPGIMDLLESRRGERVVWFIFTDIHKYQLADTNVLDLLLFLFEEMEHRPWMKVILDEPEFKLPASLRPFESVFSTRPADREDVYRFFDRALVALTIHFGKPELHTMIDMFCEEHLAGLGKPVAPDAICDLALRCTKLLKGIIDQSKPKSWGKTYLRS